MRILICPDSFKDAAKSHQVADAIRKGILRSCPEWNVVTVPLADGGENSLEVLSGCIKGQWITCPSVDPLGRKILGRYILDGDNAWFEVASSSGLELLSPEERNCTLTSTLGTGLEIKHAIEHGVKHIHIFVGGSATNDMGLGILQGLGMKYYDGMGRQLSPMGGILGEVESWTLDDALIKGIEFFIYTDVDNLLTGPKGASFTYARQKGASDEEIAKMDHGMIQLATRIESNLDVKIRGIRGGGAAGGIPAGCRAFLNARIQSASELFFEIFEVEDKMNSSDVVITGEGRLDGQSTQGKLIGQLVQLSQKTGTPLIAVCGSLFLSDKEYRDMGLKAAFSILQYPVTLQEALPLTLFSLEQTGASLAATLSI